MSPGSEQPTVSTTTLFASADDIKSADVAGVSLDRERTIDGVDESTGGRDTDGSETKERVALSVLSQLSQLPSQSSRRLSLSSLSSAPPAPLAAGDQAPGSSASAGPGYAV
mmetsp:Transcript_91975/g.263005  ORF Transcript_91975/g.263005 Transcript_91975/m.263005 type:complete len:111 (+) Transcript_91975:1137-1469(+)